MTIDADKRINVTFSAHITSFDDWFPAICTNHSDYDNDYMFDGAQKWKIHNLIVTDYDAGDGYGLIRTESDHGDIECAHCSFTNITNTDSDHSLFETWGSFHFYDSAFDGIVQDTSLFYGGYRYYTGFTREFVVDGCRFVDISSVGDMIELDGGSNDVKF